MTRYYRAVKESAYIDRQIVKYAGVPYDPVKKVNYFTVEIQPGETTMGTRSQTYWFDLAPVIDNSANGVDGKYVEEVKKITITAKLPKGFHIDKTSGWDSSNWTEDSEGNIRREVEPFFPQKGNGYQYRDGNYGATFLAFYKVTGEALLNHRYDIEYTTAVEYEDTSKNRTFTATYPIEIRTVTYSPKGYDYFGTDNLNGTRGTLEYNLPKEGSPDGESANTLYSLSESAFILENGHIYDKEIRNFDTPGMVYTWNYRINNNGGNPQDIHGGMRSYVKEFNFTLFNGNNDAGVIDSRQEGLTPLYYKYFYVSRNVIFSTQNVGGSEYTQQEKDEITARVNDGMAKNTLYGVDADGVEHEIGRNIPIGQAYLINDTEQKYKSIILRFDEPVEMENTIKNGFVSGFPTAAEIERLERTGDELKYFLSAHMERALAMPGTDPASRVYGRINSPGYYAYTSLNPVAPEMHMDKAPDMSLSYAKGGTETVEYSPYVDFTAWRNGLWGSYGDKTLENLKFITLLPPGVTWDGTLARRGDYKHDLSKLDDPEIIENFRGTGKTAVIYTLPEIKANSQNLEDVFVGMRLRASAYTPDGVNDIVSYLTYPLNDIIIPFSENQYVDQLDLDGDGDHREMFATVTSKLVFAPPLEMIAKTFVDLKEDVDEIYSVTTEVGEPAYYALTLVNNSVIPRESAYMIDVLPYADDTSIMPKTDGTYAMRGSEFFTGLSGPAEDLAENEGIMSKVDIFYSTVTDRSTIENVRDGEWLTKDQVADFSKVTAVKVQMKSGQVVEQGGKIRVVLPLQIPNDASLADKSAVNSIAMSTDGVLYNETNRTVINLVKYIVDGVVFKDMNEDITLDKNGLYEEGEEVVPGTSVALYIQTENGWEPAIDLDGQTPIATTTDARGRYHFDVYKRGTYRVVFEKDNVYSYTDSPGVTSDNSHDVIETDPDDENRGLSHIFNLMPETPSAIANAGLYVEARDVKVIKTDAADETKKLSGAEFTLTNTNDDTDVRTGETGDNGEYIFKNVPYGTYTLAESNPPAGYAKETETKEVTISRSSAPVQTFSFRDVKIKGSVTVTKVDAQDSHKKLEGVKFVLKQGDTVKYTEATDANGQAVFSDIPYGEYTLEEAETLPAYVLSTETKTVSITTVDQEESFTWENTLKKGTVTLKKIDTDTKEPLSGVTFGLYKEGEQKASYEQITDADGNAVFENVVYGVYTLRETATLESHNLLEEGTTVNIDEDDKTIDLGEVTNTIKKGTVELVKTDAQDETITLSGARFGLFAKDGAPDADSVYTAESGQDGRVLFTAVNYGEYVLKELTPPQGYVLSDEAQEVSVTEDGQEVRLPSFVNTRIHGHVTVKKVDADDSEKTLEGVTFVLKQDEEEKYEAVTDENGVADFENVEYGQYTLAEKATVESHLLSNETRNVVVDTEGQTVDMGQWENMIKKGSVTFTKVDAQDETKPISGVMFGLFAKTEDDSADTDAPLYTAVSDDDGQVRFDEVNYGSYVLREIKTVSGYVLSDETREVSVTEDGQEVKLDDFVNKRIHGSVTVTKVDADEHGKTLSGVTFVLKQGDDVKYEAKTGQDGTARFENVEYGTYTLAETETIDGYELSKETREVSVAENGKTVDAGLFENKHVPEKEADIPAGKSEPKSPKTGDEGMPILLFAALMSVSAAMYVGARQRRAKAGHRRRL